MGYPYFRRSGDTFYKVIEENLVTKIEPDANIDYYQYAGLTGEDYEEVLGYTEIPEQDWNDVLDDVKECSRVGSRPNIPPPPQ